MKRSVLLTTALALAFVSAGVGQEHPETIDPMRSGGFQWVSASVVLNHDGSIPHDIPARLQERIKHQMDWYADPGTGDRVCAPGMIRCGGLEGTRPHVQQRGGPESLSPSPFPKTAAKETGRRRGTK